MFQFNFDSEGQSGISEAPLYGTDYSLPWERKAQTEEELATCKRNDYKSLSWDDKWLKCENLPTPPTEATIQYVWHFDMINDKPRNNAYHHAISKVLQEIRHDLLLSVTTDSSCSSGEGGEGKETESFYQCSTISSSQQIQVLDVGTGSGLLALLAAKQGATVVTAIEVEAAVARVASINVNQNGLADVVKVHNGHSMSTAIQLPSPVQLVVTELLDTGLLGEAFIPVLRDARRRGWMTEGCRVIPARGRVFGQLVESDFMHKMAVLDSSEAGFGFNVPEKKSGGEELISPFDCSFYHLLKSKQARVLSEPFVAWDFNFEELPPSEGRSKEHFVSVTAAGKVQAVLFWWEVGLDREGQWGLSSEARGGQRHHQDHWVQAFTVINPPAMCEEGQELGIKCFHNDENIWFEISDGSTVTEKPPSESKKPLRKKTDISDLFDSERVFQMNCRNRNSTICRLLHKVLQESFIPNVDKRTYCVALLGDGPLLPLVVADCFNKCLSSLQELDGRQRSLPHTHKIVSLEGNEDCQALSTRFLFANSLHPPAVTCSTCDPSWALSSSPVHLICGEPFFQPDSFSKTWGKSSMLRYWLSCHALTPFLAQDARLLPARAVVQVAALECPELWRARLPCSGPVEELDLNALNSLHSFLKTDSIPLWRYDHRFLSRPRSVLALDFWCDPSDESLNVSQEFQLEVSESGTCHAFVMWIDYSSSALGRGEEGGEGEVWCPSAPSLDGAASPHMQGVRFFPQERVVRAGDSLTGTAKLDALGNDINVTCVHFDSHMKNSIR